MDEKGKIADMVMQGCVIAAMSVISNAAMELGESDEETSHLANRMFVDVVSGLLSEGLDLFQKNSVVAISNRIGETETLGEHKSVHFHWNYQEAQEGHFCLEFDVDTDKPNDQNRKGDE